jgi:pyridoxine 4-dehydrogenase
MIDLSIAGTFTLGDRVVNRLGYGAMQLAGPGVFGPPKDRNAALAVLREAVASGVNTSIPATSMDRTSPIS